MSKKKYQWAAAGDVNAFFGLMLDNVADLLLTVGLLAGVFQFPATFAIRYMVPGTAIGVLVGDLLFFWMALSLAKRAGRHNITAMPLGLDTPSTFGMVFFVLGPAFVGAKASMSEFEAATYAWHIGICSIFISGLFKFVCAFFSNLVRTVVPRAGLLGSLAAIALVLISFLPLVETMHAPVPGLIALAIILTTLVGRIPLPRRIPGALGALLVAGGIYHLMACMGWIHVTPSGIDPRESLFPIEWTSVFRFEWTKVLVDSLNYLPIVIPFALATVVGGIDCTESAAAAGDEFDTGRVIAVEALATLVASLCGGVIQTTPYIGHPAYKAMGGRAAYVLATALFVGAAGVFGFFGLLYVIVPKPAVFPILVFIGLEITAQSFHSTKWQHYPAVAIACVPALAYLALIFVDQVLGEHVGLELSEKLTHEIQVVRMLSSGFIVTSLLWASSTAAILDRKLSVASIYLAVASFATLFGIIHSPLPGSAAFLPWRLDASVRFEVLQWSAGYLLAAGCLLLIQRWTPSLAVRNESESHFPDA
ncbi:MAG: permease [Pirellulaceae bacterium]